MNYAITIFGLIAVVLILVAWMVMSYRRMRLSENSVSASWTDLKEVIADRFDVLQQVQEFSDANSSDSLSKPTLRAMNAYSRAYKSNDPQQAGYAEKIFVSETIPALASTIQSTGALDETRALREGIARTDKEIKSSRKTYNERALRHNNNIAQIPANILASVFNVEEHKTFLAPEDADRQLLNLRFD